MSGSGPGGACGPDSRVETISRLAQWRIDTLPSAPAPTAGRTPSSLASGTGTCRWRRAAPSSCASSRSPAGWPRSSPLSRASYSASPGPARRDAPASPLVLNKIVYEPPEEHPLSERKPLREILGHTAPQVVAGCILGIIMAVIMHLALERS